jgi:hypothetical protein
MPRASTSLPAALHFGIEEDRQEAEDLQKKLVNDSHTRVHTGFDKKLYVPTP